jgi:hypothetical protein
MEFSPADSEQLELKGLEKSQVNNQIDNFRSGFPYLILDSPATIKHGIIKCDEHELQSYIEVFENRGRKKELLKFVPASGAASRMFKELFECYHELKKSDDKPQNGFLEKYPGVKQVFKRISNFAFSIELITKFESNGKELSTPVNPSDYELLLELLLEEKGLNYGNLPKGLLLFHMYNDRPRTSFEEHLVEGSHHCKDNKNLVKIHFTVSPEHIELFRKKFTDKKNLLEKKLSSQFQVEFSIQKPSTDTIAVDMNNQPFRENDGSILFRPGGHGALLENLNQLDADIIFMKNIDNIVPDRLRPATVSYKKCLAGILLEYQEKIFNYLCFLDGTNKPGKEKIEEMELFLENQLCVRLPAGYHDLTDKEKPDYIRKKLNRPVRVCGMVVNEGEPGGGPFLAVNSDGSVSLQVVETSQIDMDNPEQKKKVESSTHFNPVDLVCGIKDYKGKKFDLVKFRDPKTGFISGKSKDGRELKAQELPGLWNGAMSDWNTIFVETPIETFNPVKTINDLLRENHQPG